MEEKPESLNFAETGNDLLDDRWCFTDTTIKALTVDQKQLCLLTAILGELRKTNAKLTTIANPEYQRIDARRDILWGIINKWEQSIIDYYFDGDIDQKTNNLRKMIYKHLQETRQRYRYWVGHAAETLGELDIAVFKTRLETPYISHKTKIGQAWHKHKTKIDRQKRKQGITLTKLKEQLV